MSYLLQINRNKFNILCNNFSNIFGDKKHRTVFSISVSVQSPCPDLIKQRKNFTQTELESKIKEKWI